MMPWKLLQTSIVSNCFNGVMALSLLNQVSGSVGLTCVQRIWSAVM